MENTWKNSIYNRYYVIQLGEKENSAVLRG